MKTLIQFCLIMLSILSGVNHSIGQMAVTSAEWDMRNGIPGSVKNSYVVKAIEVDAVITNQVAKVSVSQTLFNPGKRGMEVEVFFPLPNQGIVQNFTMMVDGKEIPGKLLPKAEATGIYEGIVRRKQDPALMEYVGYGLYKTSVFPIAVGQERTITVSYTQVLSKQNNSVSFTYPLGTQKFSAAALKKVRVSARIITDKPLKSIFSPDNSTRIERIDKFKANVEMTQQNIVPENDFKLSFSMDENEVGATVLSYKPDRNRPGYFMLMASPGFEVKKQQPLPKNIIFVLDKSGSMSGKKIQQSTSALNFVLRNLNAGDKFNIITYDDRVEKYQSTMQVCSPQSIKSAEDYVFTISAGGGTNIHEALQAGLKMTEDKERPNYILFLTDGLASSGITSEQEIINRTVSANKNKARIFTFGVGQDVNARLLDRLSMDNAGSVEYVSENEDIESAVGKLYAQISSPVMTNLTVTFAGTNIRETYPEKLPDIFQGGQLIWVGKYDTPGSKMLTITGDVNGVKKNFTYRVELAEYGQDVSHEYVEKIWASRRVSYLIGMIDQHGQSEELVQELVSLSKEYGILTPYTSFLAREDVILTDNNSIKAESKQQLNKLKETSGMTANSQRAYKNSMVMDSNISANSNTTYEFEGGKVVAKANANIRQVGNKTFYKRKDQWIDGTVKDPKKNVVNMTMFSSEYFNLSNNQSADLNRYIALDDNVVVEINGQVYNITRK